jgi:hypothetical protein
MSSGRDRRWLGALVAVLACNDPAPPRPADLAGSARAPLSAPPAPSTPPAARTPPAPSTRTIALDPPAIELPRQESFQLLGAGTGKRATLRYAFAAGSVDSTAETALSSRQLEHGGFTPPAALPAIRDGFAITVAEPGAIALHALPGTSTTPSAQADAYLAPWRTLLQHRRITVAIDERGAFTAIAFVDDPAGARSARARDELVQRLLATIMPLPVEPVGTGASWRVVTILRQGPAYAKQTATYTLRSRGPERWKLHVALQRVGEEQRVQDPSLPPGTTADLLALFRRLEGDVEIDPRYPMIAAGSLAIESRMHVRLQPPGQPAIEQIFEDTGTAILSLCQPTSAPAPPGATRTPRALPPCPGGSRGPGKTR